MCGGGRMRRLELMIKRTYGPAAVDSREREGYSCISYTYTSHNRGVVKWGEGQGENG